MLRPGLAALALPLALAGCSETSESDGTLVIRFASWVLLLAAAGGIALAAFGVLLVKAGAGGKKALVAFLPAVLLLGFLLPGMAIDRVVVTAEEIRQTTGFWFRPTRKGFRYADVRSVRIEKTVSSKGLPCDLWILAYKDGRTESLDPGDLWENSSRVIVSRLREHGLDIQ